MQSKILKTVAYVRVDDVCTAAGERIVRETALKIKVDGRHHTAAMLLANLKIEFVVGNLYVQGVIKSADEIKSVNIKNDTAEVTLAAAKENSAPPAAEKSSLKVKAADVFACVKAILKSEVFTETEAVHSAGLFLEGKEAVCIAEDLGRHNALDKVIGRGLLQKIDFSRTVAASTGRQPSEMINKCRHAGIPIIATKGVPTSLAVAIADRSGITIAGLVRGDTMILYSHPERIEGADEE